MREFTLKPLEVAILRAAASALNKMAARLVTAISRYLRGHYNILKRDLDQRFTIEKASANNLTATILVSGQKLSLVTFNPKQTKEGVQVVIIKGKPVTIKNVFMGKKRVGELGSIGNQGVFQRKGKERLPIKLITGPDVASLARSREIAELIKTTFHTNWERIFQSELKYYRSRSR